MSRQTSVQLTEATERQAAELKAAGFGTLTDIIRVAVDRMHKEETKIMSHASEFEVKVIEWTSRPGCFGPAVIRKDTGEIASGPWVEDTRVEVVDLPYRTQGMVAAASITTPDGNHHYSYLL